MQALAGMSGHLLGTGVAPCLQLVQRLRDDEEVRLQYTTVAYYGVVTYLLYKFDGRRS